jgi:hypothetical protein
LAHSRDPKRLAVSGIHAWRWSWNKLPFRFDQAREVLLRDPRNSPPSNRANAVVTKSAPKRPHRPLKSLGRLTKGKQIGARIGLHVTCHSREVPKPAREARPLSRTATRHLSSASTDKKSPGF